MNRQTDVSPSILSHYTSKILKYGKLSLSHLFQGTCLAVFICHQKIPVYLQSSEQGVLDLATLTAYVSYARKHIHPKLSDEAAEELTRGYVEMRRRGNFPGSSKKVSCYFAIYNIPYFSSFEYTCLTNLMNECYLRHFFIMEYYCIHDSTRWFFLHACNDFALNLDLFLFSWMLNLIHCIV